MPKMFVGLFAVYALVLLFSLALGIPVALWQWIVFVGLGSSCFTIWRANAARQEKIDSIYGRYDRPSDGKPPEYHGL